MGTLSLSLIVSASLTSLLARWVSSERIHKGLWWLQAEKLLQPLSGRAEKFLQFWIHVEGLLLPALSQAQLWGL